MERYRPDAVVVQGDTTSTFVGALTAFNNRIPVVQVEAGLHAFGQSPLPGALNRRLTTCLADLHLAPTLACKRHLLNAGVAPQAIVVTGNTEIDALLWAVEQREPYANAALDRLDDDGRPVLLVIAHRRESWGPAMHAFGRSLGRLAELDPELTVVIPVPVDDRVRAELRPALKRKANVIITEPLSYGALRRLMKRATIVVTDSGGIQEEAPSLGKPVLVMRDTTDRVEAVVSGTVRLIGTDEDGLVESVRSLLRDNIAYRRMATRANPYGDGRAAIRTVKALEYFFAGMPTATAEAVGTATATPRNSTADSKPRTRVAVRMASSG